LCSRQGEKGHKRENNVDFITWIEKKNVEVTPVLREKGVIFWTAGFMTYKDDIDIVLDLAYGKTLVEALVNLMNGKLAIKDGKRTKLDNEMFTEMSDAYYRIKKPKKPKKPKKKIYFMRTVKWKDCKILKLYAPPTQEEYGKDFDYSLGPFKTMRAAKWFMKYGEGNPHCVSVGAIEKLAKADEEKKHG
jgi:hypothetical protein